MQEKLEHTNIMIIIRHFAELKESGQKSCWNVKHLKLHAYRNQAKTFIVIFAIFKLLNKCYRLSEDEIDEEMITLLELS